jgi:REP-associated tyrosine transposase
MSAADHMKRPLLAEEHYHIFNRSIGYARLFFKAENYLYFKEKLRKYSIGYWKIYAFALLPDHFHILIKVLPREVILDQARQIKMKVSRQFLTKLFLKGYKQLDINRMKNIDDLPKDEQVEEELCHWIVSEQWRKLFLSYSKAINRQQERHGSLFQKSFRRKHIGPGDLKNLIQYIHRNPVHHGYTERAQDYPWSSYSSLLHHESESIKDVQAVLSLYEGQSEFTELHDQYVNDWIAINPFDI